MRSILRGNDIQDFKMRQPVANFFNSKRVKGSHKQESQNNKLKDDDDDCIRDNLSYCHELLLTKSLRIKDYGRFIFKSLNAGSLIGCNDWVNLSWNPLSWS